MKLQSLYQSGFFRQFKKMQQCQYILKAQIHLGPEHKAAYATILFYCMKGTYCSTISNVLVYKPIQYIPLKVHKSMISNGLKLKYSSFPSAIKLYLLIPTKALYNCNNNLAEQRTLVQMKKLTFLISMQLNSLLFPITVNQHLVYFSKTNTLFTTKLRCSFKFVRQQKQFLRVFFCVN